MDLLLIPLLPLISFIVLIFIGRRLGKLAPAASLMALAGSLFLSVRFFVSLARSVAHSPVHVSWAWLSFGGRPLTMGFLADSLSLTMCLVVTVVGWLIMLYSIGTMRGDPRFSRFFAYLSLFFSAMLTLVLADHFVLLYVGWELVGLCSYLLISFWFERPAAANAGRKAFLTTRVGDLGLLAAILLLARVAGDLSFTGLEEKAAALGPWTAVIAILIFWGAAGKSAQFPLHVWLPDAMEGPTPVSALIHAATMVAAGVYLVARTMPLFLAAPEARMVVAAVGGITSFFAATVACTQTDLKKILAYSTISQLGFMMLGLGAGSAEAGMFHLVTHAWFKALLFLGAGSVIHAVHHQDVTRMGGLGKAMPVTALTFTLAAVAMAGIPPFSGFWSKEEILAAVHHSLPPVYLWLGIAISGLTAFYITRAAVLTFWGKPREAVHPHESPAVMTIPLSALAMGAAGIGWIYSQWVHGAASAGSSHAPEWIAPASIGVAGVGIALAFAIYWLNWKFLPAGARQAFSPLYRLAAGKYFVDELIEATLLRPIRRLSERAVAFDAGVVDGAVNGAGELGLRGSRMKRWIDEHLVDGAVNALAIGFGRAGATLRLIQTGLVQNYLLIALAGMILFFFLFR